MDSSPDQSTQLSKSAIQSSGASTRTITGRVTQARTRKAPNRPRSSRPAKTAPQPIGQFYARSTNEDGEILSIDPVFQYPCLSNLDLLVVAKNDTTGHPCQYAVSSVFSRPGGRPTIAPRFEADPHTSFEVVPKKGYELYKADWPEGGVVYGARPIGWVDPAGAEPSSTASQG